MPPGKRQRPQLPAGFCDHHAKRPLLYSSQGRIQRTGSRHDPRPVLHRLHLIIEPLAIVKLNNDIRELELEEQKEIEAVLAALSEQTAQNVDAIRADLEIMIQLDFIFARAGLAMDMNATEPIFNTEKRIRLKQARHPLIPKKKAVPIDIRLGEDFDLLVVTGPNTGGKTVSLKTVGLLTLMGQAGLHIPALDRSELSVFREVYADIGDEQSIEQSLSTFSSHMTNVVSFLEKADQDSLVLFRRAWFRYGSHRGGRTCHFHSLLPS